MEPLCKVQGSNKISYQQNIQRNIISFFCILFQNGSWRSTLFSTSKERVVTHDVMVSVRIITIQDNNLWGVRSGGQITNRFSRDNRNGSWKRIRGIAGYYVRAGTIINGHGRQIQIWATTIKWKDTSESVKKCPIISLYNLNCLVLDFSLKCHGRTGTSHL